MTAYREHANEKVKCVTCHKEFKLKSLKFHHTSIITCLALNAKDSYVYTGHLSTEMGKARCSKPSQERTALQTDVVTT